MAILLSGLCLLHCLILPVLLVLLPWTAWLVANDERVHRWLLVVIVPISAYALIGGCSRHRKFPVFWLGAAALGLLVVAAMLEGVPDYWESLLTFVGGVALVTAHLLNLRELRRVDPARVNAG